MKKENIVLLALPVFACSILLYLSGSGDFEFFTEEEPVTLSQKTEAVKRYNSSKEQEYDKQLESGFDEYQTIYQEEHAAFKAQINDQWGEFKPSSDTEWVSYVDQGHIRRSINYESGKVSVELLVTETESLNTSVKRHLEKEVFSLLNTTEAEAFRVDEVAQKVEARLPSNFRMIKRGVPSEKRLFSFDDLVSVKFNNSGFVKVSADTINAVTNDVRPAKVDGKKIIRSSFSINKSTLQKAIRYADVVQASSEKQEVPAALIYAIMESESSFNPMAKSHIPAYGLMQIVPRSAGKDATRHLYGKAKILAPSYLYSTDNNINVGSAYLHVLYYKYLRKVKDPQSRIYCAIAAYNTGTTNVARAFIKKKNFNKAVKHINRMSSKEVYQTLVKRLPYKETRNYVKKVSKKMKKYLEVDSIVGSVYIRS